MLEILQSIGVKVTHYEVIGCHRLNKSKKSKYPAKTIIRFTNRKVVEFCISNRDRLLEVKNVIKMNLRFHENLCQSNEKVYNWCSELKRYNIIHDFFTRNGFVKIIIDKGDRPIKIRHPDELYDKFDYFDYYKLY